MKRLSHTDTCIHSSPPLHSPQTPLPSRPPLTLSEFHVLSSRSLLAIHSKWSSVYMPIPNSLTIPFPNPSRSSHELWVNWWEWRWGLFFRPELGSSCWLNPTDNCWQLFNMSAFLQVPHLFFPTTRDSVWNFSEAPLCTGGHRKELRPGSENKSHVRWESRSGSRRISYLTHLKPTNSLLEIRTIWMILFWSLKKKS